MSASLRRVLLLVAACAFFPASALGEETADSLPRAERSGTQVKIGPEGPSFAIPSAWVEWQERSGHALHGTREELAAAKDGGGEWDREYAEVMNAILDHSRCGFQGGGDGWGEHGHTYGDLQMRTYVWPQSVAGLTPVIEEKGACAVAEILRPTRKAERDRAGLKRGAADQAAAAAAEEERAHPPDPSKHAPERFEAGVWQRRLFTFDLHYGDYGATAHVDVRARDFGARALVFVFCYTDFRDHEKEIAALLDSVRWPDPPQVK